jgi:hypothetical protein
MLDCLPVYEQLEWALLRVVERRTRISRTAGKLRFFHCQLGTDSDSRARAMATTLRQL